MISTLFNIQTINYRDFLYFGLDIFKVICCRFIVRGKGLTTTYEPIRWKRNTFTFGYIEDPDQPVYPHSLVNVYTVRILLAQACKKLLSSCADSEIQKTE